MAMFEVAQLLNHSCAPNCAFHVFYDEPTKQARFKLLTLRSISQGEELTIAYLGVMPENRDIRWKRLGFNCNCSVCGEQGKIIINETIEKRKSIINETKQAHGNEEENDEEEEDEEYRPGELKSKVKKMKANKKLLAKKKLQEEEAKAIKHLGIKTLMMNKDGDDTHPTVLSADENVQMIQRQKDGTLDTNSSQIASVSYTPMVCLNSFRHCCMWCSKPLDLELNHKIKVKKLSEMPAIDRLLLFACSEQHGIACMGLSGFQIPDMDEFEQLLNWKKHLYILLVRSWDDEQAKQLSENSTLLIRPTILSGMQLKIIPRINEKIESQLKFLEEENTQNKNELSDKMIDHLKTVQKLTDAISAMSMITTTTTTTVTTPAVDDIYIVSKTKAAQIETNPIIEIQHETMRRVLRWMLINEEINNSGLSLASIQRYIAFELKIACEVKQKDLIAMLKGEIQSIISEYIKSGDLEIQS